MLNLDWKYTKEQAQAIKNGDILARNTFFMDNYEFIEIMAKSYYSQGIKKGVPHCMKVDELINQAYLDLHLFNFENVKTLTFSLVKRSFYLCKFGGWSYFVENKRSPTDYKRFNGDLISIETNDEKSRPLIDLLACSSSAEDIYLSIEKKSKDFRPQIKFILDKYLCKRQSDFLEYWLDGFTDVESARKIGTTIYNVHKKKALDKLRVNYADIIEILCESDCDIASDYVNIVPSLYEQSKKALTTTPEQKAKHALQARERRARKKMSVEIL